jgi:hypothetical protein
MAPKPKHRRQRLVDKGGVECFEVRIVAWFASDGRQYTSHEVTTPDGNNAPMLNELLGAIEVAKAGILEDAE